MSLVAVLVLGGGLVVALTPAEGRVGAAVVSDSSSGGPVTYGGFGSYQGDGYFVVPRGVTSVHVVAHGGPAFYGGLGASVSADVPVTPGEYLIYYPGGVGTAEGMPFSTGGSAATLGVCPQEQAHLTVCNVPGPAHGQLGTEVLLVAGGGGDSGGGLRGSGRERGGGAF